VKHRSRQYHEFSAKARKNGNLEGIGVFCVLKTASRATEWKNEHVKGNDLEHIFRDLQGEKRQKKQNHKVNQCGFWRSRPNLEKRE
jgi:hypothetical protein